MTTATQFKVGQQVMCNGHVGFVRRLCEGQLDGMAEVALPGGMACVALSTLDKQYVATAGNRAVVINGQDGRFWANLYVNARNGICTADITAIRWDGRTLATALRWANKQLGLSL